MSDMGLTSIRQRAKAMYEKERKAYCKNRLNQNFTASGPNEIWVSDVTCYSFQEWSSDIESATGTVLNLQKELSKWHTNNENRPKA